MSVAKGLRAVARSPSHWLKNTVTVSSLTSVGCTTTTLDTSETAARKLSAVDRCIEILSDSMAKLPTYCVDRVTRERVELPLLQLLNIRPNEAMAPSVRKKLLEASRLTRGNSYDWIRRNPYTAEIVELIPQCIQKNESCLSNLEKSELEACSLSDLLICHYLSRLLEIDPEEINSMRFVKKKKTKVQEGDNFSAIAKVGRMRSR